MKRVAEPRPTEESRAIIAVIVTAGRFTDPDLTAEQMVEKVRGKMKEMHIPGFLAKAFTKNIPTLSRWAKQ
jgi:hypothetical protein